MRLLLKHWSEMDKEGKGQTAAEVIRRLYRDTEPWAGKPWFAGLKMAIESVTDSDKATASQLGYKLRAYQRRVLDGKYMDRAGSKSNAIKWAVFDAADLGQVRIGGIVRIPATEVKTKERDHQFAAPPNGRRVDHPNDPKHPHPVGGNRRRLEPSHNGRANR